MQELISQHIPFCKSTTAFNYDLAKETSFKKSMSIVISGIAVSNSNSSNEFLKKHQLFLLGCMCSKDTGCTCDLFEILWVQSDDIISWREISPAR